MPSRRKPALRNSDYVNARTQDSRSFDRTFESKSMNARAMEMYANQGREDNGSFMRSGDKARLRTAARQVRLDSTSKSQNNYKFGSKEEVNAQHRSTYRDIRKAFGMTTG